MAKVVLFWVDVVKDVLFWVDVAKVVLFWVNVVSGIIVLDVKFVRLETFEAVFANPNIIKNE